MKSEDKNNVLFQRLPLEVDGQYLGLVTLNRPEKKNAMNWALLTELREGVAALSADKSVRVIAITGAGGSFSPGGDLEESMTLFQDKKRFRKWLYDIRSTFGIFAECAQPAIALVNGYCVAGGIELLLSCDLAYAAKSAKIGDGHAKFGMIGGGGSNVRLPRWIAPSKARELLFTANILSADEALEYGLVNRVVEDDKLLEAGLEFANVIAAKSPLGIQIMKRICNQSMDMQLGNALNLEIEEVYRYVTQSHDCNEGLKAFTEKRKPEFEGR
jgi:enoyl-CoA hydratase